MKTGLFVIASLLFIVSPGLYSQQIKIDTEEEGLNDILIGLRDEYSLQFSFNDRLLSQFSVSHTGTYDSPDDALLALFTGLPLYYQKSGEVYVILEKRKQEKKQFLVSGKVCDLTTLETLPYSHVIINGHGMITDMKGSFSYLSERDSLFKIKASYLGYFILDTVLVRGTAHTLCLKPSVVGLREVRIEGESIEYSGHVGESPGTIRLNNKIARKLPGNGDNSVFNYLRLQPGVLAAGEQSGDLIIWGGYEGQSKVLFDGFTLFGLKNFNDNISAVNPYMAKDLLVLKGGYDAKYGERISGIVDITGIEGSFLEPTLDFTINNMTLSGKASIPVLKRSSLVFAFRQTYYNLYEPEDVELFNNPSASLSDMEVIPDYAFRDYNIKYSGISKGGDNYYLSLYEGRDKFSYNIDHEINNINLLRDSEERSRQKGGSLFYDRNWKNGIVSDFLISYSGLHRDMLLEQVVNSLIADSLLSETDELVHNQIKEYTFKNHNHFVVSDRHKLEAGFGLSLNEVDFIKDIFDSRYSEKYKRGLRMHAYVMDEVLFFDRLKIKPGIRLDKSLQISQYFFQPRLQVSFKLNKHFKIQGAWGIYNQFVSLSSEVDDYGNYSYFWTISDNEDVPVLESKHLTGGLVFQKNSFTASIEAYRKTIDGITRYINSNRFFEKGVYMGYGYSYGIDLYLHKRINKQELWLSYSYGKAEESFPFYITRVYFYAPQDQRHELKLAGLINLHPFYFSANYVYGSGFVDLARSRDPDNRYPYSRMDASLIYRYDKKRYHMEAGLSFMNVFNTKNIKYSNFIRVPASQTNTINIHAEAVPFTPTVYLNFSF